MNNETLKSDLCSRLMDGVKVYLNGEVFELIACTKRGKFALEKHEVNKLFRTIEIEDFIPILFSTSCLTKPITVSTYNDGKPFVPIEEMMLEQYKNQDVKVFYHSYENRISVIVKCLKTNEVEQSFVLYINDWSNYPQWIIEFFHSRHINYRLSPDQFIEATNEYE